MEDRAKNDCGTNIEEEVGEEDDRGGVVVTVAAGDVKVITAGAVDCGAEGVGGCSNVGDGTDPVVSKDAPNADAAGTSARGATSSDMTAAGTSCKGVGASGCEVGESEAVGCCEDGDVDVGTSIPDAMTASWVIC